MGMIQLQFLGEKLREVGEPRADERKRLEESQTIPQAVLNNGGMAAQLLAQGQGAAPGVAAMLQQGAGNRAVAAMLKGTGRAAEAAGDGATPGAGEQPGAGGQDEKKKRQAQVEARRQPEEPAGQGAERATPQAAPQQEAETETEPEAPADRLDSALQSGLHRVMGRLGLRPPSQQAPAPEPVQSETPQRRADDGARVEQSPALEGPMPQRDPALDTPTEPVEPSVEVEADDGARVVAPQTEPPANEVEQTAPTTDEQERRAEPREQDTGTGQVREDDPARRSRPTERQAGPSEQPEGPTAEPAVEEAQARRRRGLDLDLAPAPGHTDRGPLDRALQREPGTELQSQPALMIPQMPSPAGVAVAATPLMGPAGPALNAAMMPQMVGPAVGGLIEPAHRPGLPAIEPASVQPEARTQVSEVVEREPEAEVQALEQPELAPPDQVEPAAAPVEPTAREAPVAPPVPETAPVETAPVENEPAEEVVEPELAEPVRSPVEAAGTRPALTDAAVDQPQDPAQVAGALERGEAKTPPGADGLSVEKMPKPTELAPNGEDIVVDADPGTMRDPSQVGAALRTKPGEQPGQATAQMPPAAPAAPPVIGDSTVAVTQAPPLPSSPPEPVLATPSVPLSPMAEQQLQQPPGPDLGPEDNPEVAAPPKSRAQIEAEAQMVGEKGRSEVRRVQQELGTEAEAEAEVKRRGAETERDQKEQQAQIEGDQQVAAEEARGAEQRAAAETDGEQRKQQATADAAAREAEATAQGQAREQEIEAQRDADIQSEEQAGAAEEAAAERETQAEEARLRSEGDAKVAQLESEGEARIESHRQEGQREEETARRATDEEVQRIQQEGQRNAEQARQQGERDAASEIRAGEDRRRREEARGRREKAAMEARARREREAQPWYKRALSWVVSKFNSLISRARGLLNAAIAAGRRLVAAARAAADRIRQAAASVARRALAVADQLTGGAVSRGLDRLREIGQAIAQKISEARAWVTDRIRAARDAVVGWVREKWDAFQAAVRAIRDRVVAAVRAIRDRVVQLLDQARQWVQERIAAAQAWLREQWDAAVNWVRQRWEEIRAAVTAAVAAIVARVQAAVQAAYEWCAQKIAEIGEALAAAWEQFKNWAQEAFVEFWNGPWRDVLIGVGVALLIAATVATGGAAGILLAVAVGAATTGAARMGGEVVARRCTAAIRQDPERAARFEARQRSRDPNFDQSDFGQWYAGVDPDESWGETLRHGAVEGAKGAVEGAVIGLTGGAGGALGGVAARSIGRAAAREGARVLARRGAAKTLEYGARTGIEFGLNVAGDVGQGYGVAAIDVAAGNRTWEEARARYVDPHLTPGAMLAKATGAGMSGGLRMGSHLGPRTAVQDRIVGRVTGNAGSTVRGKVMREMVDSSISGVEGGTTAGLQSMANGGEFMDGFGQGFVGGMGSHHARLAGEAYARGRGGTAPASAPEPTGPRRISESEVDVDVDLDTGRTQVVDTSGGQRRTTPTAELEAGPATRRTGPIEPTDVEPTTAPTRRTAPLDVDIDGTRPRTDTEPTTRTETDTTPTRTQPMEVETDLQGTTQRIEMDPEALRRAQSTEPESATRPKPDPQAIRQRQAEAVQDAVAGRLPGLPSDQRVVPDGTSPMPAGAMTVTQALRYRKTVEAMSLTPEGRATLADIDSGQVRVVVAEGLGSEYRPGPNEIVLDVGIRGRHNRAGVLAHEGHHARTRGETPDFNSTDRDAYVHGMLRNEAESQARLFEYHRSAGTDSSREFGYEPYIRAYDAEVARLRAENPGMAEADIRARAVEAGTQALHTEFGNAKPSNSEAASYDEYYGRYHDEHSAVGARRRGQAGEAPDTAAPEQRRTGDAEPESPTRRASGDEADIEASRRPRMTPEEVAADPLRANLDDLLASEAGQRRLYELAQEAQGDANTRVGRIVEQYEGAGGGVLLKRDGQQRFIAAVEEKVRRKNYPTVGGMGDAVRGRISLQDGADIEAVLRDVQSEFPTARFDRKADSPYPRVHVDIEMPNGVKLELQVGTHATTRFLEQTMVEIPPSLHQRVGLTEGDFHVAKYDIVDKITDPSLRARYGLDEFDQRYNQALRNTGTGEVDVEASQRLATDLGAIMRQIESDDPALLQSLYTKDSHAPAPAQGAPRAQVDQELSEPATPYDRRRQIVGESGGQVPTHEAYTVGDVPSGGATKAFLDDPQSWVPERRQVHDQLVSQAVAQARSFSEQIGGDPTIYAMRGNTAAGKTTAVKGSIPELAAAGPTHDSPHRAINPDNFKQDLMGLDPDLRLTHQQVHAESSTLARRLTRAVMEGRGEDGRPLSVLVDKRLEGEHDVTGLAEQARQSGRRFNLYDVDAPLEMSLIGVLNRQPGGDSPIVPFKVVADEGFYGSRKNRMAAIEQFIGKEDGNYTLFGTRPDGSKATVAEVVRGELTIHDRAMFEQLTADPRTEIDRIRGERITPELIDRIAGPMDEKYAAKIRGALEPHVGRTWEEAVTEHGKARPPQSGPSMPAPEALRRPETSYRRRADIVAQSGGRVQTHEAYTVGDLPSGGALKPFLDDPASWVPERRALHDQLLQSAVRQARTFSDAVGGDNTLYAMRGNTAAGKTRAIKGNIPELEGAVEATKASPHRAINPDNFKKDLMDHDAGSGLTHMQVHNESSSLARRLHRQLMEGDGSILVDKRLEGEHDVTGLVQEAAATGRQFNLYDVDAPLEMSLVGVLLRQPGGSDPIVPFKVVADEGFYGARKNRAAAIEQFVGTDVGKYQLFGTTPEGAKVKVAEVIGGELTIHDRAMFEQLTADPKAEIDRIRGQQITDSLIDELTGPLDKGFGEAVRGALAPHVGRTWEEAVAVHGQAKPSDGPAMPSAEPVGTTTGAFQAVVPAGGGQATGGWGARVPVGPLHRRSRDMGRPQVVKPVEEEEEHEEEERQE